MIPAEFGEPVTVRVAITPELPAHFTGPWIQTKQLTIPQDTFRSSQGSVTNSGSSSNDLFLVTNLKVLDRLCWMWYYDASQWMFDGCPGDCNVKVIAPALAVTSSTTYRVPANGALPEELFNPTNNTIVPPLNRQAFMISSRLIPGEEFETIRLVTGYSTSQSCAGDFSYTVSDLRSAIGEYAMSVRNDIGGIVDTDAAAHPKIFSLANNTRAVASTDQEEVIQQSTLGSIVEYSFMGWADWVATSNFTGSVEIAAGGNGASEQYYYNVDGECEGYQDPHFAVIARADKLMVNAGWTASTNHTVEWLQERMNPGTYEVAF